MAKIEIHELKPEDLRWSCKQFDFSLGKAEDAEPTQGTVGQDRAIAALKTGLEVPSRGYNVFVCGLSGTGRRSSVKEIVKRIKAVSPPPPDRCYVYNFSSPDKPVLIELKKGQARELKNDMDDLIERLKKQVPRLLEDKSFGEASQKLEDDVKAKGRALIDEFEKKLEGTRFTVAQVKVGPLVVPDVFPVLDDKPATFEDFEQAVAAGKAQVDDMDAFKALYQKLKRDLADVLKRTRRLEAEALRRMKNLTMRFGEALVEGPIEDLKEKYGNAKLTRHLNAVAKNIVENLNLFRSAGEQSHGAAAASEPKRSGETDPFLHYRVNVLLDNTDREDAPIVIETEPTPRNLFGTIDLVLEQPGQWRTDFMHIKGGSLLAADGGYLIVNAIDVLSQPGVWEQLKRTLKNQQLRISIPELGFPFGQHSLQPEPIDLNVKVIMIGDAVMFDMLYGLDDDFKKIFKIKAEFDTEMPLEPENVAQFMSVVSKIRHDQKLMRFRKGALCTVLEYAIRRAGRRDRVSTRFGELADLMSEANLIALNKGAKSVSEEHVQAAVDAAIRRNNLLETKLKRMIKDGTIMIDTDGAKVGQVNGLAVFATANYTFGQPARITASTAAGDSGIINIEREADLSGSTHDKGVLILAGFLRHRFGQNKPLNLSASICFEQSYSGIDGDSASSTELYCIISSLAEVPIKQGIAVTGSVNQKGEVQPIGGVNYKIEGFFDVCKAQGLTGEQGVVIPRRNVESLMLRKDVVEAVAKGSFHIYPVDTIDEGIEVLTGMPAGKADARGNFPRGTVNYLANRKLEKLVKALKESSPKEKS
ncbi:MAG: ATP-dependent protease [Candidatus Coatesbacteria bacterium]|nr:MAG: ATP-dependent protease [Candidatus Coatesbacteria bacterium]